MMTIEDIKKEYGIEMALVIVVCRVHFKTYTASELQGFIDSNEIDWNVFYSLLKSQSIRPFVYHIIISEQLHVDSGFLSKLKRDAQVIAMKNLHQSNYLCFMINEFEKLGIRVIPYKGVSFASRYYPSVSMRESSDIDLLVSKKDVKKIREYFHTNGFVAKEDVPDEYLNYFIRFFKEIVFKSKLDNAGINCSIEIQWRLVDRFRGTYPEYDFFFDHIEVQEINHLSITGLKTMHDFLAVISHHIVKEPLGNFKSLVDLGVYLQGNNELLNKKEISDFVIKYGFCRKFSVTLNALEDLLGLKFEFEETYKLKNMISYHQIFQSNQSLISYQKLRKTVWEWQDNYRTKLKYAFMLVLYLFLPSCRNLEKGKIPIWLFPIWIFYRPISILFKYNKY